MYDLHLCFAVAKITPTWDSNSLSCYYNINLFLVNESKGLEDI